MARHTVRHTADRNTAQLSRRALLTRAAASGAAVTSGLIGPIVTRADASSRQSLAPPTLGPTMRRIVTAHDAQGMSYIASDEVVPVASLWTTRPDQPLGAAASEERLQVSHATGETRHFVATIQPSKDPKPNLENRLGFHRTPGIAYCYMLTGEIVFLVDTKEVRLKAGDLVVERNTMHSWRNEGSIPVSMLITTVTMT